VRERFAANAGAVWDVAGLDLARDRLPVAPAAHYCMGGIRTDTWGRTDMPGLYAAGEVACSGAQGANRLASNSLLECLVFGARTAEAALNDKPDAVATWTTCGLPESCVLPSSTKVNTVFSRSDVGARLDADVGVERDGARLSRLVQELPEPESASPPELLLAALIARAALRRRESRGAHFRTDARDPDPTWRGRIHWRRDRAPVFEEVLP
jgi:L-aspartate oxidase